MSDSIKTCNTCGHKHLQLPQGGKLVGHGYYFPCQGGCNSTMFLKISRYKELSE